MDKKAFITKIKTLVAAGDVEQALEWLAQYAPHFFEAGRQNDIMLLQGRYNQAEEDYEIRNIIEHADFNRIVAQVTAGVLEILEDLEKPILQTGHSRGQKGQLLHTIPGVMPLQKEVRCIIRIAFDLETLIQDILVTPDTTITEVRIAEVMAVELIDFNETPAFFIRTATEEEQFLEESDYTQWLFMVKAIREGRFPLTLKVSVIEAINGKERRRDIVLEKEVFIVNQTDTATSPSAPPRFEPTDVYLDSVPRPGFAQGDIPESIAPEPEPAISPMAAPPSVAQAPPPQKGIFRRVAMAVALLIVGIGGYLAQMDFQTAPTPSGDLSQRDGSKGLMQPENEPQRQDSLPRPPVKPKAVKVKPPSVQNNWVNAAPKPPKPPKTQPAKKPIVQAVPLPPKPQTDMAELSGDTPEEVYIGFETPLENVKVLPPNGVIIKVDTLKNGAVKGFYVAKNQDTITVVLQDMRPQKQAPIVDVGAPVVLPKVVITCQLTINRAENGRIKTCFQE